MRNMAAKGGHMFCFSISASALKSNAVNVSQVNLEYNVIEY